MNCLQLSILAIVGILSLHTIMVVSDIQVMPAPKTRDLNSVQLDGKAKVIVFKPKGGTANPAAAPSKKGGKAVAAPKDGKSPKSASKSPSGAAKAKVAVKVKGGKKSKKTLTIIGSIILMGGDGISCASPWRTPLQTALTAAYSGTGATASIVSCTDINGRRKLLDEKKAENEVLSAIVAIDVTWKLTVPDDGINTVASVGADISANLAGELGGDYTFEEFYLAGKPTAIPTNPPVEEPLPL